jgi:hypothetical protein
VVISHGFWERQFGRSAGVLGTRITLNGRPHEVVGVMPRDFDVRMLDQTRGFELWTLFKPGEAGYVPGGTGPIAMVGRLRAGVTLEAARAELADIHRDVEALRRRLQQIRRPPGIAPVGQHADGSSNARDRRRRRVSAAGGVHERRHAAHRTRAGADARSGNPRGDRIGPRPPRASF